VAILGAGFAGLAMGVRLKQAGLESFTIHEKASGVGGTWRDNSYPGAGCDIPSHLYSFSFDRKADWSRHYVEQPEILRYIEGCVDRFGLGPHVRFGSEIASARFVESAEAGEPAGVWRLTTTKGETSTTDVVVSGLGQLNRPSTPEIPGLADFAGKVFHSARWDHAHDLDGARVAVIGSGASAIQFVPRIAPRVGGLHLFQRSPNWILSRSDAAYADLTKAAFRRVPGLERAHRAGIFWAHEARGLALAGLSGRVIRVLVERAARKHLEEHVADPALRAALTPDYPIGCKRVLISDDYYPALTRPNVEVVTAPIARIDRGGVVTTDGRRVDADTIIFATGFAARDFLAPLDIAGRGGARLSETWRYGAEAYLGAMVAGFPNLFMLYGPNTNLGHNSIIFMIECQVHWILRCLGELDARRRTWIDVRRDAMLASNLALDERLRDTVWAAGCESWYKTDGGKVTNNWPGLAARYWLATRRPRFQDFSWSAGAAEAATNT
jgi:cation diffusion facilitator CzcD-associated flavoprotein CzcO